MGRTIIEVVEESADDGRAAGSDKWFVAAFLNGTSAKSRTACMERGACPAREIVLVLVLVLVIESLETGKAFEDEARSRALSRTLELRQFPAGTFARMNPANVRSDSPPESRENSVVPGRTPQ